MNTLESRLKIDFPFRLRPDLGLKAEELANELGLDRDYLINELLNDCFELMESETGVETPEFRQRFTSLATLKRFKERLDDRKLL